MGVPKLLTTLAPYGERKPLDGAEVIIDGPALAYHAVSLCQTDPAMVAGRNHPLEQPTYDQLSQAAVAWLDALRGRDVVIRALYFDGYLPEPKRPVRLERAYRTSAQFKDVFASYQRDNLPGFDVKGPRTGSLLPAPAFAVPAVLDALRQSAVYGPLTTVVPGEADTFCAEHACTKGHGTVITSDSDLLVQDLGPDGEVVFFRDIDLRGSNAEKPLIVLTYSMATICTKLNLRINKGMHSFAFELFMDPHLSLSELVERAKQESAISSYPREYADFAEQYSYPSQLVESTKGHDITGLDPRVSELVLQCLLLTGGESSGSSGRDADDAPYDSDILAFSPPLLDSCTRANAWEASASIRCCAFSLPQVMAARRIESVREYTRMTSMSSRGSLLGLLPVAELSQTMDSFMALFRRIQAVVESPALQWVVLSSYYDIQWSSENSKEPACLAVLCQETPENGVLDRITWNAVHWLAQVQGNLYSLRILKQIAEFVFHETDSSRLDEALSTKLAELIGVLSTVTPLAEYPTLRTLRDLPARLKGAGGLELLAELVELPDAIKFQAGSGLKKNKNKSKKRKRADPAASTAKAQTLGNPFSILDGAE